jgi:hypothetical protein
MNDGCNVMSVAAAREIWSILGGVGKDAVPSAYQSRFNGAKGVWMINASIDSTDENEQRRWIRIGETQQKFEPNADFNEHRRTLEIVTYSKKLVPSILHESFILILVDRGVSIEAIANLFQRELGSERAILLNAIKSPEVLIKWLRRTTFEDPKNEITASAAPPTLQLRVKSLLESGFHPLKNRLLGMAVREVYRRQLIKTVNKFGITLPKSTYCLGVADPTGTLKPGEIFISFSHGFLVNDNRLHYLESEVLVARHPAIRPSDIQKVRAVYREELRFLTDVVVFASTGCVPLASKLGGGDYDGDNFWVCWEPDLVGQFKNAPAPAPQQDSDLEKFGIKVDRRLLSAFVPDTQSSVSIDDLLRHAFTFRLSPNILGLVTHFHKHYCYKTNDIGSTQALLLADLHDLLVDSSKNGYSFTKESFESWKWRNGFRGSTPIPVYEAYAKQWETETPSSAAKLSNGGSGKSSKSLAAERTKIPPNLKHPLDYLLFKVIKPFVDETISLVEESIRCSEEDFEPLLSLAQELGQVPGPVGEQIRSLEETLTALMEISKKQHMEFNERVCLWKRNLDGLEPDKLDDLGLRAEWVNRIYNAPSKWDLVKASVFMGLFHQRELAFSLFWSEYCYLQAMHTHVGLKLVVTNMWAQYKPKKLIRSEMMELDDDDVYGQDTYYDAE